MLINTNFKSRVNLAGFDASSNLNRGANKLKEGSWYIIKIFLFLTAFPYPNKLKIYVLKLFGANIGKNVVIKPRVNIHLPWKLNVGDNVWIGEEVFILNFEGISIGNNVCISQRAFLCGGNHNYLIPNMPYKNGQIILNDGCWIGASSFIGPNVSIGVDTVITVGSIVTRNVDNNVVCRISSPSFTKIRWKN
jgi:putative colanic acid biosynthesis acetyltransferase WcaF